MKRKMNRMAALLLAVLMVVTLVAPAASAAEGKQGETVSLYFSFSDVHGIDGEFTFSNRDLFSSVNYVNSSELGGSMANDKVFLYTGQEASVSGSVVVQATIRSDAKAGESCTVTFTYETSDENGNMSEWMTSSQTVTVVAAPTTEPTQPSQPTNPTNPTSPTSPTTPPETTPNADMSELERQVRIAEGLKEEEYTKDSWDKMLEDLNKGREILENGGTQQEVDTAAKNLADSIKALVKMDYSKLEKAIEDAKKITDNDDLGKKITNLVNELTGCIDKLKSRDQKEVDEAAEKLAKLVEGIAAELENVRTPQVVEVEKKVEVEVPPKGEYCNIPMHKVWPVLFFVSLAVNVALIVLIIVYISKKKKNQKDNTPLVDYDIADDEN